MGQFRPGPGCFVSFARPLRSQMAPAVESRTPWRPHAFTLVALRSLAHEHCHRYFVGSLQRQAAVAGCPSCRSERGRLCDRHEWLPDRRPLSLPIVAVCRFKPSRPRLPGAPSAHSPAYRRRRASSPMSRVLWTGHQMAVSFLPSPSAPVFECSRPWPGRAPDRSTPQMHRQANPMLESAQPAPSGFEAH